MHVQIRCGDLYNDKAIATFNACAVSDQKCVPQKIDRDVFPEPKPEVLDKNFDLGKFEVSLHFLGMVQPCHAVKVVYMSLYGSGFSA